MQTSEWVLDIHSFPPAESAFGPYQLVLLDDGESGPAPEATMLFEALTAATNSAVGLLRGQHNDIEDEARALAKKSILLEWAESTQYLPDNEVRRLCDAIARVVVGSSSGSK